ncbi:MAG: DUF99 family protein, partial [Nanoarchaeota archaeon]
MKKSIKKEIRILGIDDSPFSRNDREVLAVGIVYRGGNYLDGLLSFHIKRDGKDATEKIIRAVKKTRHKEQLQLIMLDGLTLGGFNVADIQEIRRKTKFPVIAVMRKKPDMKKFFLALKKAGRSREKLKMIERAGKIHELKINKKNLYIQTAGISLKKAESILKLTCLHSNIPEPLRVAHLIASGIVNGE